MTVGKIKKEKLCFCDFDGYREDAVKTAHLLIENITENRENMNLLEKTHDVAEALLKDEDKIGTTIHYIIEFLEERLGRKIPVSEKAPSLEQGRLF